MAIPTHEPCQNPPWALQGPYQVTPWPSGRAQGGGRPQCRGVSPPLLAPSGAPRDPFLSPRFGTGIGTASAASFGNTQLRHRTGRGAPEHVNMGVNSMSTMSLLGRPGVTHRPFLDSQLDPPRALFGHPRRLNPQRLNGTMPRGEKDPVIPSPGLQVPIKALGSGASFNIYIYIYIYICRGLRLWHVRTRRCNVWRVGPPLRRSRQSHCSELRAHYTDGGPSLFQT